MGLLAVVLPTHAEAYGSSSQSADVQTPAAAEGSSANVVFNANDRYKTPPSSPTASPGSGTGTGAYSGPAPNATPPPPQIPCASPANPAYTQNCNAALQKAATPQNSALPANWRQQLQQVINRVEGQMQIDAGTIGADPDPGRALVNLPQCYWLDGASDPDLTMTLDLAGAPAPDGQQVQYEFVVAADRSAVNWSFGDGDGSQSSVPVECTGHDATAAHQYTTISEPGKPYRVTATEVSTITVTEYWQDWFGPHDQQLNLGLAPVVVTTPAIETTVGQEEGVPVSSGTNSSDSGG